MIARDMKTYSKETLFLTAVTMH